MALERKFTAALSDQFLDCLVHLEKTPREKVQQFITKFRQNPASPGLNYEKIREACDPNMRSVRVDRDFRAIVLRPEKGNVYLLLWVDRHDDAYAWARRRRCMVHPDTGSLQLFTVEEQTEAAPATPAVLQAAVRPGLFDTHSDEDLRRLGVPPELMPRVRQLETVAELEQASSALPSDAHEALSYLAMGETLQQVFDVMGMRLDPVKQVDPEDFAAALEHPVSKAKFVVVTDDLELQAMLDAPLEKWRVFLHPSQRRIVERSWSGPVRVLGGAGTGKTVAAMHRANYLAKEIFKEPHDRILFTTFTRNLAADIEENLRKICRPEVLRHIEVVHLDKWVHDFLRRQGYKHEIHYFGDEDGLLESLWSEAMGRRPSGLGYPDSFYREEWDEVVQTHGCTTLQDYFQASRAGRGVRMDRAQRKAVWPVFEEYRNLMADRGVRESVDAMRDARLLLERQTDALPYRSVLVDEAQDMSNEAFRLIRNIVPPRLEGRRDDLFIVGDGHQRIYSRKVVLGHCGIQIVGRAFHLRINYRTTEEIRRFAVGVLEGATIDDLDGGVDLQQGYQSLLHGRQPEIRKCKDIDEEVDAILGFLGPADAHSQACLVTRTAKMLGSFEDALRKRGIDVYPLKRSQAEDRTVPGLRLATMHRVKGLEFEQVILAGANDGIVPLRHALAGTQDEAVREAAELRERALFYVAATRAKSGLLITCHGRPSPFITAASTHSDRPLGQAASCQDSAAAR